MKTDESKLNTAIKTNNFSNLYYFYGKEEFLVKTYTDRIINKILSKEDLDFNLIRFEGNPSLDALSNAVSSLPVFAEKKIVVLNDFDAEKLDADTLNAVINIFSDIPESSVIITAVTGFEVDAKKAKTKKLISSADKYGVTCEFDYMQPSKVTELIIKKAARLGVIISRDNALLLSELTLRSLTLIGSELDKLCSYAGKGGEITKPVINLLVSKQLDSNIFELANMLVRKNTNGVFNILNDLISEGYQPVVIMSSLSSTFVDFYRIKLAKNENVSNERISVDFNYAKNRVWLIGKTASTVNNISIGYIRKCLEALNIADYKLKSSPVDNRIIMEQALTKILVS